MFINYSLILHFLLSLVFGSLDRLILTGPTHSIWEFVLTISSFSLFFITGAGDLIVVIPIKLSSITTRLTNIGIGYSIFFFLVCFEGQFWHQSPLDQQTIDWYSILLYRINHLCFLTLILLTYDSHLLGGLQVHVISFTTTWMISY